LSGYDIEYTDLLSLYVEYKDIFFHRIYHFDATHSNPVILDGGGCIGMSVLYFKRIYPAAEVICFEPDPSMCRLLARNIEANKLSRVRVVDAAMAAEVGTLSFAADGSDGGRIHSAGAITVRAVRLSDYLDREIDFLKLNIEGQELAVLREAASNNRLRNVRQIVLEYHGWPDGEQRLGPILTLLEQNGYRYLVHDFDKETNPHTKPPFRLQPGKAWFCLVYAIRMDA
jgi:FkbM family methyltransferase